MSTWHGMRGPFAYLLPDEEDDPRVLIATSAAIAGVTYLGNALGTYLDYRLVYHAASGNLVRREIMRQGVKKAGQATIYRGLGLAAVANPFSAFLITATLLAYSLPPSGRPRGNIMPGDVRYTHIPE